MRIQQIPHVSLKGKLIMKRLSARLFNILALTVCAAHVVTAADFKHVDIHGFLSQGFLWSDRHNYPIAGTKRGTTQFNEAGINFTSEPTDKLHLGLQLFTRTFGSTSETHIGLDWAVADYRWKDWGGLRAGRIKRPKGLYNESRDVDQLRPMILLPSSVYNEQFRSDDLSIDGFSVYGTLLTQRLGSFEYQAMTGSHRLSTSDGVLASVESAAIVTSVSGVQEPVYIGSLIWNTPLRGLRVGGTAGQQTIDLKGNAGPAGAFLFGAPVGTAVKSGGRVGIYTASIEYAQEKFTLFSEFLRQAYQFPIGNYAIPDAMGWYIGASVRPIDRVEFGSYYSEYYPNENDTAGNTQIAQGNPKYNGWGKDTALFGKFDINPSWSFKVELHHLNGTALLSYDRSFNPNPPQHSILFASKLSYSF
jgi:hypothetical protein